MTSLSQLLKPASSPSRSLRLLQLLAVFVLVGLVSTVAAVDPVVSSATCANSAGWCANVSTVVFTGTDLTTTVAIGVTAADQKNMICDVTTSTTTSVTCTLIISKTCDGCRGEYPVYMSGTYVGNLIIGAFYEQKVLAATPFNKNGVETEYFVAYQSNGTIWSGGDYTLYGNFSKNTTYDLIIFNDERIISMSSPGLPTCTSFLIGSDEHNSLICKNLTTMSRQMGVYAVMVQDRNTKRYLPGSAVIDGFIIYPPNATLTSASGDCVTDSSKCVTGTTLSFTGSSFNVRVPSNDPMHPFYINFSIGWPDRTSGIHCEPSAVSGNEISGTVSCVLSVASTVTPGPYPVYLLNMVQHRGVYSPPQHIGNLLIGTYYEWNPPGFNTAVLPDDLDYRVTGISETIVPGDYVTIYGYFPMTGSVNVLFYDTEAESANYAVNLPTCVMAKFTHVSEGSDANIRPNAVTCMLRADSTEMGTYGFMLQDATTGFFYRGSTAITPFVFTRNITISSVTGACALNSSYCVTGATLTFTGKEMNVRQPNAGSASSHFVSFRIGFTEETDPNYAITCTTTATSGGGLLTTQTATCQLTIGASATYGMYPIYMFNQITYAGLKDNGTHIGNLMYGTFPEWEPMGFNYAPLPDDTGYMVTGQDNTIYDHLGTVTIFGAFPQSKAMNVHFYNLDPEMEASNGGDIGCRSVTSVTYGATSDLADNNAIACVISTNAGKMGTYRFMVEDAETGWIYPGSAYLEPITILHRDANVHSVSFTCPNGATSCTTGGVLKFTGDHLNVHQPPSASPYKFYINFYIDYINPSDDVDDTTKITCVTTAISGGYGDGYATCELTFGSSVAPGTYPIYAINYASDRGVMHTPAMVGSLVVGKDGTVSTAEPWLSNTDSTYLYNVTAAAPVNAPDGTVVTLFGSFNTTASYTVTFSRADGTTDKTPTCTITAVTKRTIRCTMVTNGATVSSSTLYYPMVQDGTSKTYLKTSFSDSHTLSLVGKPVSNGDSGSGKLDKKAYVATMAVMIVFIVLFLAMVIFLIVLCCCCELRRKGKRANSFHGQNENDEQWNSEMVAGGGQKENVMYTEGPTLDTTALGQLIPPTQQPQDSSAAASTVNVNQ